MLRELILNDINIELERNADIARRPYTGDNTKYTYAEYAEWLSNTNPNISTELLLHYYKRLIVLCYRQR